MSMMNTFCQKTSLWDNDKIGASDLTVGAYGCAGTAVCDLTTAWPDITPITPKELFAHKDWFTPDGLILWGKLNIPHLKFDGRMHSFCPSAVMAAVKDPNRAVLAQVFFSHWTHWAVVVGRSILGTYRIADPLTGTYRNLPKDWTPTGAAFFRHE